MEAKSTHPRDLALPDTAALLQLGSLLPGPDWNIDLEKILRVASEVLQVERANYWRFREHPRAIVCELGYHASGQRLDRGAVIWESEAPRYFTEIRQTQVLAIEDARRDPRSRELARYLDDREVGALLDVPVRAGGVQVGMLCHEHVGRPRSWSARDRQLALAASQIVAARLEARARSQVEDKERRTALLVDVLADLAEGFEAGPAADLAVGRALPTLGEMAALVVFDGGTLRHVTTAHETSEGRALLDEIERRYPPRLDGPGFASFVIREQESILLPAATREAMRPYGIDDQHFSLLSRLRMRSLMATLLRVRGRLKGAMVFASTSHAYDQSELRFAELYTQQIGAALENASLYEKAQAAIAARDDFLSLASHELRTPLTTLSLSAHALSLSPVESVAQMSQRIVRQVERLDRLADRMLDASEIGARGPSVHPEPIDLAELVHDVAHAFEPTILAAGARLVVGGDREVAGRFDPVRVQQAVSNLIENAIKFGRGTPIEVDVRARDGQAVVSVQDGGAGIPLHERSRVFGRYERGEAATGVGGLGLGLHIVRAIAEGHGGTVVLESEPGQGTTVRLQLPLGRG